jgi:heat-inducible transcriptional repressor
MDIPDDRLTPRKREILRAVIRDYILTAEPVGSRTLSKRYDLGLSPATIRNELSDLEEEGLLRQPHTSAGRIPSDHGYRVFVDNLMERTPLSAEQLAELERDLVPGTDLTDLLSHTAKLTALLAGCTAIVRAPRQVQSRIKFVQILPVAEYDVLLTVLTDQGQVTNQLIRLPSPLDFDELLVLSNFLNEQLRDQPLDALTEKALRKLSSKLAAYEQVIGSLVSRLKPAAEATDRLIVSHQSLLANQPEFGEVGKIGRILSLLERDREMIGMMDAIAASDSGVQVAIGTENPLPDLQECSLVTATYRLGDRVLGEIAVIGPTRMHYATAMSVVEVMAQRLSQAIGELFGIDPA